MAFERELEIEVSPDVHAPQRVRAVLEAEFADLGDALFAAQVIASELVTNAILHGEPPVRLEVFATATGLRLVVHDGRPDVGLATPASRGLRIVNVLAADWGMTQTADGKCFWAEIAAPSSARGCDQPAARRWSTVATTASATTTSNHSSQRRRPWGRGRSASNSTCTSSVSSLMASA